MKSMSRFSRLAAFAIAFTVAVACGKSARIDATVDGAADVIVKLLDVNQFKVLDTVKVDDAGKFTYKVEVLKGQPEFVYLFHGDRKVASLLVQSGDRIAVKADTLGNYTVEGSGESLKLAEVEQDYAAALARMTSIVDRLGAAKDAGQAQAIRQELGKEYISYYRSRVKYVMSNSRSLSVVPVFYQTLGEGLPVFGQGTDAIHFKSVADSLETVYPESKYVKALRTEAEKRMTYLELQTRLESAQEIAYPEIELPDIKGQKLKLTDVDSKVVMLQFWSAAEADQKMFNLDVLKPIYEEFHSKGFEIYQVALDIDKGMWAQVVKQQQLPWISVCDSRGAASPYVSAYNLPVVPATFIIADGELVDGSVVDEKSLRKLLKKLL